MGRYINLSGIWFLVFSRRHLEGVARDWNDNCVHTTLITRIRQIKRVFLRSVLGLRLAIIMVSRRVALCSFHFRPLLARGRMVTALFNRFQKYCIPRFLVGIV